MGTRQLTLTQPSLPLLTHLAGTMALEDRQELWGYDHSTPLDGLTQGVALSKESWVLTAPNGHPVTAFGIQEVCLMPKTACFWLLASTEVPAYKRDFLRWSRAWMQERGGQYDWLVNFVGEWHIRSQRWLQWLGFTLSEPYPFGVEQWPWRSVLKKGNGSWD